MCRKAHLSKSCLDPNMDAGVALEDLAYSGIGEGKQRPLQVEDFCGDHTCGVYYMGVECGVHLGHHCTSTQEWRQVPWNWPGGGAL